MVVIFTTIHHAWLGRNHILKDSAADMVSMGDLKHGCVGVSLKGVHYTAIAMVNVPSLMVSGRAKKEVSPMVS